MLVAKWIRTVIREAHCYVLARSPLRRASSPFFFRFLVKVVPLSWALRASHSHSGDDMWFGDAKGDEHHQ